MDYSPYKAIRQFILEEHRQNREETLKSFADCKAMAESHGLKLVQHTDAHYSLEVPNGWRLNIYPGNRRLFHDQSRPKGEFLKVSREWSLMEVVCAACSSVERQRYLNRLRILDSEIDSGVD